MLFSILALYLTVFPFQMPPLLRPALLGSVEITTGIQMIASSVPGSMGALLIIGSAAFGGFSGIFQTKSVLKMPDCPSGIICCGKCSTARCPVLYLCIPVLIAYPCAGSLCCCWASSIS